MPCRTFCSANTQLLETSFSLGGNIVLFLSQVCDVLVGSRLHCDNRFTSIPLVNRLKVDGTEGMGIIYADRYEKVPLAPKQRLKSSKEGQASVEAVWYHGSDLILKCLTIQTQQQLFVSIGLITGQ